jgi:hypothetical protein
MTFLASEPPAESRMAPAAARFREHEGGDPVGHLRAVLWIAFALLSSRAGAQDDRELYEAEVCNQGQIPVEVAVAYTDFGFINEFFAVHGWQQVRPGACRTVFSHLYAPQNWLSFQSFPVHLAFGFEDSTGVWGAARVATPDWDDVGQSRAQLCVKKEGFSYEVIAEDPQKPCTGAGEFLIPASILWEPTSPTSAWDEWRNEQGGPARFTVALGAGDRAIPAGPQASTPAPTQGPGVLTEFVAILRDAIKGPGAPKPRIASDYPITNFWLEVCTPPSVYKKWSWTDPEAAAPRTVKHVVRRFLASHQFRSAGSVAEETLGYASAGQVGRKIRVTEALGSFSVEEVAGTCPGDSTVDMMVFSAEQPVVAPTPTVQPAPEPNPGFGDLMGPGGFIEPLPEP